MMKVIVTQIRRRLEGVITEEDLREAFDLPAGATIRFEVPRGGDYSGLFLEVKELRVYWEDEV